MSTEGAGSPRPGEKFGKYQIERELGRGREGVVYRAHDADGKRHVALKVFPVAALGDQAKADRFHRMIALWLQLPEPQPEGGSGVVRLYESGQVGDRCYLATELVEGQSLSREGRPAPETAARWVADAARAVAFLHEHRVLHRDLKPDNILLGPGGRICVTDLGLARPLGEGSTGGLTRTAAVIGTPAYMAPEQARGENSGVGPHSDVYALGGVLYFLLTGHAPFSGGSEWEVSYYVLHTPPVRPATHNPALAEGCNPALVDICLRCLSKVPGNRPAAARDVEAALRAWLDSKPTRVRPLSWWGGLREAAFRHPMAALISGVSAAVTAVLLVALAVVLYTLQRALDAKAEADRQAGVTAAALAKVSHVLFTLDSDEKQRRQTLKAVRANFDGLEGQLSDGGSADNRAWVKAIRASVLFHLGELDQAVTTADEALQEGETTPPRQLPDFEFYLGLLYYKLSVVFLKNRDLDKHQLLSGRGKELLARVKARDLHSDVDETIRLAEGISDKMLGMIRAMARLEKYRTYTSAQVKDLLHEEAAQMLEDWLLIAESPEVLWVGAMGCVERVGRIYSGRTNLPSADRGLVNRFVKSIEAAVSKAREVKHSSWPSERLRYEEAKVLAALAAALPVGERQPWADRSFIVLEEALQAGFKDKAAILNWGEKTLKEWDPARFQKLANRLP